MSSRESLAIAECGSFPVKPFSVLRIDLSLYKAWYRYVIVQIYMLQSDFLHMRNKVLIICFLNKK